MLCFSKHLSWSSIYWDPYTTQPTAIRWRVRPAGLALVEGPHLGVTRLRTYLGAYCQVRGTVLSYWYPSSLVAMLRSPNQQSKRKRAPAVDVANIIEGESRRVKRRKNVASSEFASSVSSIRSPSSVSPISTINPVAGDASIDIEVGSSGGECVEGEENVSEQARQVAADLGMVLLGTLKKVKNSRCATPLSAMSLCDC